MSHMYKSVTERRGPLHSRTSCRWQRSLLVQSVGRDSRLQYQVHFCPFAINVVKSGLYGQVESATRLVLGPPEYVKYNIGDL